MERRDFFARSGYGAATGFLAALNADAARVLSELLSSPPAVGHQRPIPSLPKTPIGSACAGIMSIPT